MPVGPEEYRQALRRFASGLTVITVAEGDRFHGMTATSFASVSLEPPLILVSLVKSSHTRELVLAAGAFAVNVLAENQEDIARGFSRAGHKPFENTPHLAARNGGAILEGVLAWLECRVYKTVDAGDHDIVIGEVLDSEVNDGAPLVYFNRAYRRLRD